MKLLAIMLLMLCTTSMVLADNLTENLTVNITENVTENITGNISVEEIKAGTHKDTLYVVEEIIHEVEIIPKYHNITDEAWINCSYNTTTINLTENLTSPQQCLVNITKNYTTNKTYDTTRVIVRIVGKDYDEELTGHLNEWEKLDIGYWEKVDEENDPPPVKHSPLEPLKPLEEERSNTFIFYIIITVLFIFFIVVLVWKFAPQRPQEKTPAQTAKELLDAGYPEEYAEKVFNEMKKNAPKRNI